MKKILYLFLMLCSMTPAWAVDDSEDCLGDGSKGNPYTGFWHTTVLADRLKVGDYLSYDCMLSGSYITVFDTELNQKVVFDDARWEVGEAISYYSWPQYQEYCDINADLEERKTHTFLVTGVEVEGYHLDIQGHYSGLYSKGDGSEQHPYTSTWYSEELGRKIKVGDYLASDCVINRRYASIIVSDSQLDESIVDRVESWTVGDPIDATPWNAYTYYIIYNALQERIQQKFVVTEVIRADNNYLEIKGHYTGQYESSTPGYFEVRDYVGLQTAVKANRSADDRVSTSKIRLMADIYLNDSPELCNTFSGEIDGNGYTIYAGDQNAHHDGRGLAHGKYLFVYSDGAAFRNLTFKDFRADTQEHSNWAILTSQARNQCIFENITFDHVSVFGNYNNVGAAAGYAYDCTFTNIKVLNGDFTVDDNYVGAVVGDADKCTFTSIEVNSCESTADDDCAGGVVGHSRNCTFRNVDVKNSFIQVNGRWVGGVAGTSVDASVFANCVIDDQTCVYADGAALRGAYAGGVTGYADHGTFSGCINSAFINANEDYSGGIVGYATNNTQIENCLNTGMLTDLMSVKSEYYSRYKNPQPSECKTKRYNGIDYIVREIDFVDRYFDDGSAYGGIAGQLENSAVSRCANLGYLNLSHATGGIAGNTDGSVTITDCLTDFTAFSSIEYSIRGLVGKISGGTTTFNNCVNATMKSDYPNGSSVNATGLFSYQKENMTEAQLASGEICVLLGNNWEQNLGTDVYPTPTGSKGLYHTRSVNNIYGTLCLPYPVKSDDDIRYYLFGESNTVNGVVQLCFDYTADVVPAGTPVLFSVRDTGDVTFSSAAGERAYSPVEPASSLWEMWGTFTQQQFSGADAESIYYISGGEICNAQTVTIAPYRAYFHGPNINTLLGTGQARVSLMIDGVEDETSALQLIADDVAPYSQSNKSYTLFGTEAGEGYRGIVVRGGKKVMIR